MNEDEVSAVHSADNVRDIDQVPIRYGNVRELRWLPVIDANGRRLIGLEEAFLAAHLIDRIDVLAPIEKAGVLRFLTSVAALVLRAQGVTRESAEGVARDGFDPIAVAAALDSIDDRLWLIHEKTPFMQEGRYAGATSKSKTAASIRSTSPGDSSKAWWGRPGDGFATGYLSVESAPAALAGFWFYSVNGNGKVTLGGIPVAQQGSAAGKVIAAGVRLWKTGENLAATLLMNTPQSWVNDTELPAWAQTLERSGQLNPIVAGTITGNAALLIPTVVNHVLVFSGAHVGGSLRKGIPPTVEENATLVAAKARNKVITASGLPGVDLVPLPVLQLDALKESLKYAWLDDPQVVLRKADPKKTTTKQGLDTYRALNDMTAGTSTLHNLRAWYLRAFNPDVPDNGVLSRSVFHIELFSLQLNQKGSYGELAGASWLSMPPGTLGGSPEAQEALRSFAENAYEHVRKGLYNSIHAVVGSDAATDATLEFALGRFSSLAEDVVEDVVALAIQGQQFTAEHVQIWVRATMTAFDESMEPFSNARTLPDIAQARQRLFRAVNRSESE